MACETPRRVLVVDDEADVRNYLRMTLEDAGFEVEIARDGFEALKKVHRAPPDLISLDLVMPDHSGVKCYRDLQRNREWARIPILVVTGHARDELGRIDFQEMVLSGPGVYLEKPVSPKTYVSAVRRLLGLSPLVEPEPKVDPLKKELLKALERVDSSALQRALEALKPPKRSGE
ncbi:response regulator [Planctomycetota bacterium]